MQITPPRQPIPPFLPVRASACEQRPRRQPRSNLRNKAFTLVELLVVIGIIIILIGILLPVINKVRYAAYAADTKNEISNIFNACNAYYTTYRAYPGPFSNDWIENGQAPPTLGISINTYLGGVYATPVAPWPTGNWFVTGTENLVLGLMGGLRIDSAVAATLPPTIAFAPAEVGLGPLNLNPANPGRQPSFFPTGSNYLMWCEQDGGGNVSQSTQYQSTETPVVFHDVSQGNGFDSPIPEFVDRYPSPGPLPILYLRARTGAPGIVSDGVYKDPTGNIASYQYDTRDIAGYTTPMVVGSALRGIGLSTTHQHYLEGLSTPAILNSSPPPTYQPLIKPSNGKYNTYRNAGAYFFNSSIPPTDISVDANANYSGRPRAVDQFILISAGPDGIYGTPDDITSFGDVSQ